MIWEIHLCVNEEKFTHGRNYNYTVKKDVVKSLKVFDKALNIA